MLIFKFTKTSTASLVSHVDNLRAVTYLFRRAGVEAEYSQGFNPHMELGFSPPLALGVESYAEYVSVRTDCKDMLLDKLNSVCPKGIRFVRQFDATVNLAGTLNRAEFRLSAKGIGDVVEEITAKGYEIIYNDRGKLVTKNVEDKIYGAQRLDSDDVLVTLAIGNDNLRPDRLVLHLFNKHRLQGDYSIVKTTAFVNDVPADEYLSNIGNK